MGTIQQFKDFTLGIIKNENGSTFQRLDVGYCDQCGPMDKP